MKKRMLAFAAFWGGVCCGGSQATYTMQDNAEFAATVGDGARLLDVRGPEEYASGHLPGAENVDVNAGDFEARIAQLDKSRPVAVYCRSGARSRTAAIKLAAQGFVVYNLRNGIMGWKGKVVR